MLSCCPSEIEIHIRFDLISITQYQYHDDKIVSVTVWAGSMSQGKEKFAPVVNSHGYFC